MASRLDSSMMQDTIAIVSSNIKPIKPIKTTSILIRMFERMSRLNSSAYLSTTKHSFPGQKVFVCGWDIFPFIFFISFYICKNKP